MTVLDAARLGPVSALNPARLGSVAAQAGEIPQSTPFLASLTPGQHIRVSKPETNSNLIAGPGTENDLSGSTVSIGGNRAPVSVQETSGAALHTSGREQLSPVMTQKSGLAMEAGATEIMIQNSLARRHSVSVPEFGETRVDSPSLSYAPSAKLQGVTKNLQSLGQTMAQTPGSGASALTDMASDPLAPGSETGLTLRTETIPANTSNAPGPAAQSRADLAHSAARQLADALPSRSDRQVEIALNPDELGSVRMRLVTGEAGVTVSILTERPETMDLLRRHIEQLASEFRKLGYESVGFDFAGAGTGTESGAGSGTGKSSGFDDRTSHDRDTAQTQEPDTQAPSNLPTAGLDLRV